MKQLILLIILLSPILIRGEGTIYGSLGRYHKGFTDREYLDGDRLTFSTPMKTIGGYYIQHYSGREVIGGGIVQTVVESGRHKNFDQWEHQEFLSITVPYIFIGKGWRFFAFNIGISAYLTVKRYDERLYETEGGTEQQSDSGGYDLSRNSSHVFPNFKIRILPEEWIHILLRCSQDRFTPTDTLMNLALVYPSEWGRFELYFGLKTPEDYIKAYFSEGESILTTNQRIGIWYDYQLGPFSFGVDIGYLLKNIHGGTGSSINSLERFSGGLSISLKW